ncbi:MAG TPA: hypothetical protein VKR32_05750 [Puia sp.]|nr:hypothetical protein [Puia sp.]
MKSYLLGLFIVAIVPAFALNTIPPRHSHKFILINPLKERQLYYKGHGTVGLILGLVLGPVGWGAAHLFTHNKAF